MAKRKDSGWQSAESLSIDAAQQNLGENIADVAGLAASYEAYHASLGGKPAPVINGFTGDQRFFLAFAQGWWTKMRDKALRARIVTDGHAPAMWRVLTVRNLDGWYAAFAAKPGQKLSLNPDKRFKVWKCQPPSSSRAIGVRRISLVPAPVKLLRQLGSGTKIVVKRHSFMPCQMRKAGTCDLNHQLVDLAIAEGFACSDEVIELGGGIGAGDNQIRGRSLFTRRSFQLHAMAFGASQRGNVAAQSEFRSGIGRQHFTILTDKRFGRLGGSFCDFSPCLWPRLWRRRKRAGFRDTAQMSDQGGHVRRREMLKNFRWHDPQVLPRGMFPQAKQILKLSVSHARNGAGQIRGPHDPILHGIIIPLSAR